MENNGDGEDIFSVAICIIIFTCYQLQMFPEVYTQSEYPPTIIPKIRGREEFLVMQQKMFEIQDGILIRYHGFDEKVIIPGEVRMIGYDAFVNSVTLKEIWIPKTVIHIKRASFSGCDNLESIVVEHGNPVYYSEGNCLIEIDTNTVVAGCKTSVIPGSIRSIGQYAFYNCSGLTNVEIPVSVTVIGEYAFCKCKSLESIQIPHMVKEIGQFAFLGNNFKSITVDGGNVNYHSEGNCLIETACRMLIAGCKKSCIPNDGSVKHIGFAAFGNCMGLEKIVVPDTVMTIHGFAFSECVDLKNITIPYSVELIDQSAFDGSSDVTIITKKESYAEHFAKLFKIPLHIV